MNHLRTFWHRIGARCRAYPRAAIAGMAVAVFVTFMTVLPARWAQNQSTDYAAVHKPVAMQILNGNGITTANGAVALQYPPLFSALLAGESMLSSWLGLPDESFLRTFAALVAAASAILVFSIAKVVYGERIAWFSALLWMTYPFNLWLLKQPNSEQPFVLVFLGVVFLMVQALEARRVGVGFAFMIGILIGVSSLFRPITIVFSLVFSFVVLHWKSDWNLLERLRFIACVLLGNALAVLPWELFAFNQTGEVIPLSSSGARGLLDGLTIARRAGEHVPSPPGQSSVNDFMRDALARSAELQSTREIFEFVWLRFVQSPMTIVKLVLLKAGRSWFATDAQWYERQVAIVQLPYLVLAMGGVMVAVKKHANRKFIALTLASVVYFWAMTIMVLSILRYMVPVIALLLIFAGVAVDALLSRFRPRNGLGP